MDTILRNSHFSEALYTRSLIFIKYQCNKQLLLYGA